MIDSLRRKAGHKEDIFLRKRDKFLTERPGLGSMLVLMCIFFKERREGGREGGVETVKRAFVQVLFIAFALFFLIPAAYYALPTSSNGT